MIRDLYFVNKTNGDIFWGKTETKNSGTAT